MAGSSSLASVELVLAAQLEVVLVHAPVLQVGLEDQGTPGIRDVEDSGPEHVCTPRLR